MSTDSLMGKFRGSRISTFSLMGKYQGSLRCGFPIGSVRFGAVNRIAPHRRMLAFLKPAPHRTGDWTISEKRTEPDRRT